MNGSEPSELSDHDLLIRIDERQQKMDRCMTNHLEHHERLEAWHRSLMLTAFGVALAALLSSIGSLIVWIAAQ